MTKAEELIKKIDLIAQELEQIIPELVSNDEYKSINYQGLIAFLIEAIKELDERVSKVEYYSTLAQKGDK